MNQVSVIVPAHNEEENIADTIITLEESLAQINHELVIVNDHSSDNTRVIVSGLSARYPNLRIVDNHGNGGFAHAIKLGLFSAKSDMMVPVMADLCDEPDTIKEMLKKMDQGFDVVCGSRYMRGGLRLGGSKAKAFFSSFVGRSLCFVLGLPTHDMPNAFKMYRRRVIESIDIHSSGFEISMEMPLKAYYAGFKITEVPTVWRERTKGSSNFNMVKLMPSYFKLYLWAFYKSIIRFVVVRLHSCAHRPIR